MQHGNEELGQVPVDPVYIIEHLHYHQDHHNGQVNQADISSLHNENGTCCYGRKKYDDTDNNV
jgi:hypothetical protein